VGGEHEGRVGKRVAKDVGEDGLPETDAPALRRMRAAQDQPGRSPVLVDVPAGPGRWPLGGHAERRQAGQERKVDAGLGRSKQAPPEAGIPLKDSELPIPAVAADETRVNEERCRENRAGSRGRSASRWTRRPGIEPRARSAARNMWEWPLKS